MSGFPQDLLSILHRSQISRQSDLTKSQCTTSQCLTSLRRIHSQCNRQVRVCPFRTDSTDYIDVYILVDQR